MLLFIPVDRDAYKRFGVSKKEYFKKFDKSCHSKQS